MKSRRNTFEKKKLDRQNQVQIGQARMLVEPSSDFVTDQSTDQPTKPLMDAHRYAKKPKLSVLHSA